MNRAFVLALALGASMAAGLVWQALELRRLALDAQVLRDDLNGLRAAHEALRLEVETRPPGPPAGGASPSEMEPPRGPQPRSLLVENLPAPGDPDPTVDTTGDVPDPAPDPCAAACARAMDCALERCGVGTTGTDALVESCRTACGADPALADDLSAGTDCGAVLDSARAQLPAYADACP